MINRVTHLVAACAVLALGACGAKPQPTLESLSDIPLAQDAVQVAVAAPKQGFFAQMMGGATQPAVDAVVDDIVAGVVEGDAVTVLEPQAATPAATPAPTQAGFFGGLFGGKSATSAEPATPQFAMGTVLPFGQIGSNCAAKGSVLGRKVDQNEGYTLYDTAPNQTGLRTHYVTGFKDNCARQFTAATSLMGDIGTHEVVRYLPSSSKTPYSVTDTAYEEIKSSYCRVGHGQPCGPKLDKLARQTTFITAYERFGSNPSWSNILLYNGEVAAMGPSGK